MGAAITMWPLRNTSRRNNFRSRAAGAESPIVLVRQLEWISEPEHGYFIPEKEERITEWQVQWLAGNKRGPNSIQEFLKHPRENGPYVVSWSLRSRSTQSRSLTGSAGSRALSHPNPKSR